MATTIQISNNVKNVLDKMRLVQRESYNDVLEFMIEDNLELNQKTKLEIEKARGRIKSGKKISHQDALKSLGI